MPSHAFVDESRRKGFSLIRCDVPLTDVDAIRSDLRALLRPGQRRIHFRKESPTVRSAVLRVIGNHDVRTTIYIASGNESDAREACITALAQSVLVDRVAMLTIETDETQRTRDSKTIQPLLAETGDPVPWRHLNAFGEPGLWIPDAIGWCLHSPDRKWRDAVTRLPIEYTWLE